MLEQHRIATVREMLSDFVRSPSLKHLRSVHVLDKLASEIVRRLDLPPQLWSKWGGNRPPRAQCSFAGGSTAWSRAASA